uniref:Uncharacterized protein n=1 Tax=Sinocyclocheilus anshuiensis TaxID=1608454 RepID=A0A671KVK4_9TELE
ESESRREEMERQMADLQEENEQLQKAQLSESEAKNKLRQETSRLTAENMVCLKGHAQDYICDYVNSFTLQTNATGKTLSIHLISHLYLGMLEYKKEDESRLIRTLILELKPRGVGVQMIPGLAAHLLFMCVRHADYLNDGNQLKSLMNSIISAIMRSSRGDEEFTKLNTKNKNCLRNFDLSEHLAINIYHQFISVMEDALFPMIIPGMLEHESLQGISSMKPTGFRKSSNSVYEDGGDRSGSEPFSVTSVLQQLDAFHTSMEPQLQGQVIRQLFSLIGSTSALLEREGSFQLMMDSQYRFQVTFPFSFSPQALELLQVPSSLRLGFVTRI